MRSLGNLSGAYRARAGTGLQREQIKRPQPFSRDDDRQPDQPGFRNTSADSSPSSTARPLAESKHACFHFQTRSEGAGPPALPRACPPSRIQWLKFCFFYHPLYPPQQISQAEFWRFWKNLNAHLKKKVDARVQTRAGPAARGSLAGVSPSPGSDEFVEGEARADQDQDSKNTELFKRCKRASRNAFSPRRHRGDCFRRLV